MLSEAEEIVKVLGSPRELTRVVHSLPDLVKATREGFPATVVSTLTKRLSVEKDSVIALLGLPERTLARRIADEKRLSPLHSDRVLRVARVFVTAVAVIGDEEKASRWLRTPNRALQGLRPLGLLDTDLGVQTVISILGRIAYGVYS